MGEIEAVQPEEHEDRFAWRSDFVRKVVQENELGYVYAYPDKRLYTPVENPKLFVHEAWGDYEGEVGLYVHIPYCTPKPPPPEIEQTMQEMGVSTDGRNYLCGYCNLYTTVAAEVPTLLVQGVLQEIDVYESLFQDKKINPSSVYFGGGTPSLLDVEGLQTIFQRLESLFGQVPEKSERAIECTPDSVDDKKLRSIYEIGFNRISFGVQTFDKRVLHYSGRKYDPELGYQAIQQALKLGFSNVNGDLIVGLPTSTREIFLGDVSLMLELAPHTITLYQDMTRPVTRFGKMAEAGILPEVSQQEIYEWSMIADDMLSSSGYERRTLTCWVKKGGGYQQGEDIYEEIPLIGFGPGARSYGPQAHYSTEYVVSTRFINNQIHLWKKNVEQGQFPELVGYLLTPDIKMRRAVIFGLMSQQGVSRESIGSRFDPELKALEHAGMAYEWDGFWRYTEEGKGYSGALSKMFFGDEIEDELGRYQHR